MIDRHFNVFDVVIENGAAVSSDFEFGWAAGGAIVVGAAAWTAANIGFQFSNDRINWIIARDESGVALQISNVDTTNGRGYAIPEKAFGFGRFVRLWSKNTSSGTETDINQGAQRTLTVMLKG
jgi:hypothetical protein